MYLDVVNAFKKPSQDDIYFTRKQKKYFFYISLKKAVKTLDVRSCNLLS